MYRLNGSALNRMTVSPSVNFIFAPCAEGGLIFLYSFDEFIQAAKQAGLPFIRAHNNAAS
ncbi:hypothetical protein DMH88_17760 [Escherichia coli]|nr:hypothetical protein [Escherichia coli]